MALLSKSLYLNSLKDVIEFIGRNTMFGKNFSKVSVVDGNMFVGGFVLEEIEVGIFVLTREEIPPDDFDIWMRQL